MAAKATIVVIRRRGRPRLDTVRIECHVPRQVLNKLLEVESQTGKYRTRVAAGVLTEWAATKTNSFYGHA
jgi:hypothetical protein